MPITKTRLAADLLLPLLDHPDAETRTQAVFAVWAHEDDDVVDKLAAMLRTDPDAKVRAEAAWGLGVRHRPHARMPLLEAIARDPDERVRQNSEKSLAWVEHDGPPPT